MLKRVSHPQIDVPQDMSGTCILLDDLYRLAKVAKPLQFNHYKKRATSHNGGHISTIRGRGMEFDEVRAYQPGDDIRTIDWRVTARTNKVHTKLYHEERERPVYCIVDYTSGMYFGTKQAFKSVIAAQVAAIVAWMAVQRGDRLGGIIYTDYQYFEIRPQNKHRGLMPFLKLLASTELDRFPPEDPQAVMTKTLERLRHVVKPGSVIFIISDFMQFDEQTEKHLTQLTQHNECFACRVTDPLELELPPDNYYVVGDNHDTTAIDTSYQPLRTSFRQAQENKLYEVKKSLYHGRIPLIEFSTDTDPISIMQQTFGRGYRQRKPGS